MAMLAGYPAKPSQRNEWILSRRGAKNPLSPWKPYASLWEEEAGSGGEPVSTAVTFLTNRECPFRCLMCDLWRNTLDVTPPEGAIPRQLEHALAGLPPARQIKLYNAGSFFDPGAIPPADYEAIARRLSSFERVIVECHPAFLGDRARRFQRLIRARLEVAVGLETAHAPTLERLNKRMTIESFRTAARFLRDSEIDLRVFILVRPPFMTEGEGREWACRSLELAFECGAGACCLIPTRGGNGAMEALRKSGAYAPPSLVSLEAALEYGLGLGVGRVFADLWDIEGFYSCECSPLRAARMAAMNRDQLIAPPVVCPAGCDVHYS